MMRKVLVSVHDIQAGILSERGDMGYVFTYLDYYNGPPVSLTMPIGTINYLFGSFPPFFEGLLPEGILLEAILRKYKLDKNDYLGQLILVGHDLVGAISIEEIK